MDILQWLQQWFSSQCDGGWEHSYRIIIDTLDNPGWCVRIDLCGTELEGKTFDRIENLDIDDDWMVCEVKDHKFIGGGDPSKLVKILQVFRAWAENQSFLSDMVLTDIMMPVMDGYEFVEKLRKKSNVPIKTIRGLGYRMEDMG